jgi:predicted aspartyl protease
MTAVRPVLGPLSLVAILTMTAASASEPDPSVGQILAQYLRAAADPGVALDAPLESTGTLSGAGLAGTFHVWEDRGRRRIDENLGPRAETTLRLGDRIFARDGDGDVREYTGVLLKRERTDEFVESGAFAAAPERCVLQGRKTVDGRSAYALAVTAPGGDTEMVYIDAGTWLPVRYAYDEDDAQVTIDLSDWRSVGGRRFPFRVVGSNGDHQFDEEQRVVSLNAAPTFRDDTFALAPQRTIDMTAPQSVALHASDGHVFVPVTLHGKTYSFMLDSGSQSIVIDERVAREAGLQLVGDLEAAGTQRTGGLRLARLDALGIGSGTLRDFVATTIDLGRTTGGAFKIDGILGYPFFAQSEVELDAAALKMRFGPPGSFEAQGVRLSVDVDREIPETTLRMNGIVDGPFLVDTGNAGEVLLYKRFLQNHPGIVQFTQSERRSYGIGGATASYHTTLDEISIGEDTLYHADTDVMQATTGAFADRFDAGNVGLGVLKNFVVTFALGDRAIYIRRAPTFDDGRNRRS